MDTELLHLLHQAWIEVAEQISCPTPLPKEEEFPLLTKMFPVPYDVPEKTTKKAAKGAKKGPCQKGAPDMSSEDETSSSSDDDEEEVTSSDVMSGAPFWQGPFLAPLAAFLAVFSGTSYGAGNNIFVRSGNSSSSGSGAGQLICSATSIQA